MTRMFNTSAAVALTACVLASDPGSAATAPLADRFATGRDVSGERCIASRRWNDPLLGGQFATAYLINCGGVSASRPLGSVASVRARDAVAEDAARCGAASPLAIAGVKGATARLCNDTLLGTSAVVIGFERGGKAYRGAATPGVAGPMEAALKTLAGLSPPLAAGATGAAPTVRIDALAAAPAMARGGADGVFDAEIALRQGFVSNRQGLFVDASRTLNDALSRLPADASPRLRADLLLEAGLADSNIRFADAAATHFREAAAILRANPTIDRAAYLEQKRAVYQALDRLNRRNWDGALRDLAGTRKEAASILEDEVNLSLLNQTPPSNSATSVVGGASSADLDRYVLAVQGARAISIAEISRGGPGAAERSQAALDNARDNIIKLLAGGIDTANILWLIAEVERQGGRLDAVRADATSGAARDTAYAQAVGRFDCALAVLEGTSPAATSASACVVPVDDRVRARLVRTRLGAAGPVIADTRMERASVMRRKGDPHELVLAAFEQAVETSIASGRRSATVPAGLDDYLDLLAETAKADPAAGAEERFFRALQSVGEPGAARQLAQLQAVVTTGGTTAARVRERSDLARQISALRYAIVDAADPADKTRLETERGARQQELDKIDAELAADTRFGAIDDRPATIADIRAALIPGEVFLKIAELRARAFGIVIGKDQVQTYPIKASARELAALSGVVRESIRDETIQTIPQFRVTAARGLFNLIAGPAAAQLTAASAIVVDPAGPLTNVPIGVLVTDDASVKAYAATARKAPNDYSKVAFLAARADISTALSPQSFLDTRKRAASTAKRPFIGFGQHALPVVDGVARPDVKIGNGCPVKYSQLAEIFNYPTNKPIGENTLVVAANALGVGDAPRVTGAAFSDTAMLARGAPGKGDLDQFEVLHFATHGLVETQNGCANIPPSLLTSIGDQGSDGFLSFEEIARLQLDANLVVLSACETSSGLSATSARRSGQEEGGKSLEGLVRAFLTAGSRAVIATYWKVSTSGESDELIRAFYTEGRNHSIGDSLRRAQTTLIAQPRFSHPYFWGAYFVVGDASKSMLTGTAVAAAQ